MLDMTKDDYSVVRAARTAFEKEHRGVRATHFIE